MSALLPLPGEKVQNEDEQQGRAGHISFADPSWKSSDNGSTSNSAEADDNNSDQQCSTGSDSTDSSSSGQRRRWFRPRPEDDDDPEDWWFASTAIPLLAATIGPLANVFSIASIVSKWRYSYDPSNAIAQDSGMPIPDPTWEIAINAVSLVCGFVGDFFLLFNFTRAVRYIVALPATVLFWYLAAGMLIGIISRMAIYDPPKYGEEIWGQAFWYAVMAAALYMIAAILLMINMLGYFLGHYTQHFDLTDDQRNLILQTMMFFTWLAGGAGVFSKIESWSYSDALYFCDVTILTVGFGDFVATTNLGRGLIFPYSIGGIIMLGLVIASISKFTAQIGHSKIVHKQIEMRRARTMERSVTIPHETQAEKQHTALRSRSTGSRPQISAPFNPHKRKVASDDDLEKGANQDPESPRLQNGHLKHRLSTLSTISENHSPLSKLRNKTSRKPKLTVLREERDRFNAMRKIQNDTRRFKRYFALTMSVFAFGVLWCIGAVVFWRAEHDTQDLTYFEALYFCYVSLLTIGYGDLSPKSNAGKPFFVLWSLIAVPTMTLLVSDLGDTVIAAYKRGTFKLADWSIMPKQGELAKFMKRHPRIKHFLEQWQVNRRLKKGFDVGPDPRPPPPNTIEKLASETLDEHDMAKKLAGAIREVANDLKTGMRHRYTYEEWVEFTRLIRFTKGMGTDSGDEAEDEDEQGLVDWDWIGKDSPMMADQHECEWVLDRLCESLDRYMRKMVPEDVKLRRHKAAQRRRNLMEGRRSHHGVTSSAHVRHGHASKPQEHNSSKPAASSPPSTSASSERGQVGAASS